MITVITKDLNRRQETVKDIAVEYTRIFQFSDVQFLSKRPKSRVVTRLFFSTFSMPTSTKMSKSFITDSLWGELTGIQWITHIPGE